MEPFKNIFNKRMVNKIASEVSRVYAKFPQRKFEKSVLNTLDEHELKERVKLIASELFLHLPKDYCRAVTILVNTLAEEDAQDDASWDRIETDGIAGFAAWPLCCFVEEYGVESFDLSFEAMTEMTKRFSSEFAIRPFIERYDQKVYDRLTLLTGHENKHVRRWVSEGTRPHLPWGMKVDRILNNLGRNILLLEVLFNDSDEYVRKSVANHLNDISKLEPKLMLKTCRSFLKKDSSPEVVKLVKHATRGLLKKGNKEALSLNGYTKFPKIKISPLKLHEKKITEGDYLNFDFRITSDSQRDQKLIVDYIIHYPKKNGELSAKVFRLRDFTLKKGERRSIEKSIHFKKVSTRTHYLGRHYLEIQVNGEIQCRRSFDLI